MPSRTTLRQIQAIIAVCEEGSFTRAAEREHATQSGISQHVGAVEKALGVRLFDRAAGGVTPTAAGRRYYRHCVDAIGMLEKADADIRALAGAVTGQLRIGLMPTFTRAALTPTLLHFVSAHPDVRLQIVEAYSGILTEQVLADELDFAIVPAFEGRIGLKSRLILRDREVLISARASRRFRPLAPVRLADCAPLKIVVPGPDNVRRRNLEIYFQSNGVAIERMIEMDAMMATFDFVARSDFVTILPGLICVNDIAGDAFTVNPIDPPLHAEFILITPARRTASAPARLFLERFEADLAETGKRLSAALTTRKRGKDGR